jgi:succinate dehydrogenase flavin-adding protein (antitoxin of CptAB toxin-antitoxin module)
MTNYDEKIHKLEKKVLAYLTRFLDENDDLAAEIMSEAENISSDEDEIMMLVIDSTENIKKKLKILLASRPRPSKEK